MARIRSTDTIPEIAVRRLVHRLGLRFRVNVSDLPGKPDLANKRRRWAIFVHGCFWHSHPDCRLASKPKSNTAYWLPKLEKNVARDAANITQLAGLGFRTLVVWECDTRDPSQLGQILSYFFDQTTQGPLKLSKFDNFR